MADEHKATGRGFKDAYDSETPRHHHRQKKSRGRRVKHSPERSLSTPRWLIVCCFVVMVILGAMLFLVRVNMSSRAANQITAQNQYNVGIGYRKISYKGKEYLYNTRITSVLLLGVDSEGTMEENADFMLAPNADMVSLIVMDGYHKKMSIIALNRNTMCTIHRYSKHGYDLGEFKDQLCLAYAYGENGKVSSSNIMNAVSQILYGVPVNDYVVFNRSTLPKLMDVIGDVTVTVPNNDLKSAGYKKGDQMVINAENIETFVRSRNMQKAASNVGRMERQKVFINATIGRLMDLIKKDPKKFWNEVEKAEKCMRTDITRNRYLDHANLLSSISYVQADYYTPEGKVYLENRWDEFYPDEEKLLEKVVEIFYIPA